MQCDERQHLESQCWKKMDYLEVVFTMNFIFVRRLIQARGRFFWSRQPLYMYRVLHLVPGVKVCLVNEQEKLVESSSVCMCFFCEIAQNLSFFLQSELNCHCLESKQKKKSISCFFGRTQVVPSSEKIVSRPISISVE